MTNPSLVFHPAPHARRALRGGQSIFYNCLAGLGTVITLSGGTELLQLPLHVLGVTGLRPVSVAK